MRPEGLERHSGGTGPLHRLDARLKLIAASVLVVTVVATPMGAWRAFGGLGLMLAFVIGLSGIPPRELARRRAPRAGAATMVTAVPPTSAAASSAARIPRFPAALLTPAHL